MTSLPESLRAQLERGGSRQALGALAADGGVSWLTWSDLHRRVAARRESLADSGLESGDVCVLVLPSSLDSAELILATYLQGAVPLLVAPPALRGTNSSLLQILKTTVRRTRAKLVFCDPSLEPLCDELESVTKGARWLFDVPEVVTETAAGSLPDLAPDPSSVAGMQLTSGTTGSPKICLWSHRGVLAALEGMSRAMALSEGDLCLNWTPLYHDMGLVNNLLLCVWSGVPLVLMSPFDFVKRPGLWLRALTETRATITWSPNFGFVLAARVPDSQLEGVRLDGVRAFYNAAERIHPASMDAFERRFRSYGLRPNALKTNFGCAENIGGATFSAVDGPFERERLDRAALAKRVARISEDPTVRSVEVASVGRPAPGLTVSILSPRGAEVEDGHVGEMALRSPSSMLGYHLDSRATRRALRKGLLRTGDLGYKRGDQVFWVGRVRETLNISGRKYDPSDFESVLFSIAELRTGCVAVFGVDDEEEGTQRAVVVAEVRDPATTDLDKLRATIRSKAIMETGLHVSDIVLVAPRTLAKTSSGKRRHRHFRRLYLDDALEPL